MLGHLDPEFLALLDETCDRLRTVFRTDQRAHAADQRHRLGGHGGGFVNVVEPGDVVVVGVNGVFGERMCDVAAPLRGRGRARRGAVGPADRSRSGCSTPTRRPRSSRSCTPRRRPACATTSRRSARGKGDALAARRLRHVARRHPGRDRRVGRRRRLQRHAEVPRRAARPGAAHASATARRRAPRRAQPAVVVPRPQHDRPRTSPATGARAYHHTAPISMIYALHAGLGARARRGPRRRVGPPRRVRRGCCRTACSRLGLRAVRRRGPPPARAHHRVGARAACRRTPRPTSGARCSTATASRSAAGSASSPARCGASGCMGHTARPRNVDAAARRARRAPRRPDDARCSAGASLLRPLAADRLRRPGRRCAGATSTGSPSGSRPASPGQPDVVEDPRRVRRALQRPRARAPARHRLRVRHLRRRRASPARSTCRRCSAARSRAPTSATGSTRRRPGNGYMPEALVVRGPVRVRGAAPAPPADRDHPPQPGEPAGRREARASATRASPCATSRSTACGRTTSATPSPPRSGRTARTS